MTVVFPIFKERINNEITNWILMGKQAPGKRLEGIRNGYGGKCEMGELPIDCAVREVKEEIGLDLKKEKLIFVGKLIQKEKQVFFYLYFLNSKINLVDNSEFVDNKWFKIENYKDYVGEMFEGNLELMKEVNKNLNDLEKLEEFTPFELDMSDNYKLSQQAKKIYD